MPLDLPCHDPQPLGRGPHRTDAFHRQPLFRVEPALGGGPPVVVRHWNEAHALHGPARPTDVNPAFVAALICRDPRADTSPYRRIRRLPRAHQVWLDGDSLHAAPCDPFGGGGAAMPPQTLHAFLRAGLLAHVQRVLAGHDGAIGCELSSGLDSNAVLGALIHGAGLDPERVHAWSLEQGGECPLLAQLLPFHRLPAANWHQRPVRVAPEDPDAVLAGELRMLGAPAQIGGNPEAVEILRAQGCSLLFSGFGGDQALSHNANNVPTDLVRQGRWRELVAWMGSRRLAAKTAAGRTLARIHRPWATARVWGLVQGSEEGDLLQRTLTGEGRDWLGPHLSRAYPWEFDGYVPLHTSIRRRVLNDWVAVRVEEESRVAAAHGLAKAFPLLDERLIGTLLLQDPALFGEGMKRGRLLHRRAFAPFLPPLLQQDPSKDRLPPEGLDAWQATLQLQLRHGITQQLQASQDWHPQLGRWWDLAAILQASEPLLQESSQPPLGALIRTSEALQTLASLSGWWRALEG